MAMSSRHPDYRIVRRQLRNWLTITTSAALVFVAAVAGIRVSVGFGFIAVAAGLVVIVGVLAIEDFSDTLRTLDKGWDQ
jgi:uncharacterized membrane protein YhiD involved in acid resistance